MGRFACKAGIGLGFRAKRQLAEITSTSKKTLSGLSLLDIWCRGPWWMYNAAPLSCSSQQVKCPGVDLQYYPEVYPLHPVGQRW